MSDVAFFFHPAVLKDLKERYFAGREDGSRLRSVSGKRAKRKRPWLSQSSSSQDWSNAGLARAGGTTVKSKFNILTNEAQVTGGLN